MDSTLFYYTPVKFASLVLCEEFNRASRIYPDEMVVNFIGQAVFLGYLLFGPLLVTR